MLQLKLSNSFTNHSSKFFSNIHLAVPACGSSSGLAHWHVSGLGQEEDHLQKKTLKKIMLFRRPPGFIHQTF